MEAAPALDQSAGVSLEALLRRVCRKLCLNPAPYGYLQLQIGPDLRTDDLGARSTIETLRKSGPRPDRLNQYNQVVYSSTLDRLLSPHV